MVKHIQTIRRLLPTNCLSVFDHFLRLALKELKLVRKKWLKISNMNKKSEKFSNFQAWLMFPPKKFISTLFTFSNIHYIRFALLPKYCKYNPRLKGVMIQMMKKRSILKAIKVFFTYSKYSSKYLNITSIPIL